MTYLSSLPVFVNSRCIAVGTLRDPLYSLCGLIGLSSFSEMSGFWEVFELWIYFDDFLKCYLYKYTLSVFAPGCPDLSESFPELDEQHPIIYIFHFEVGI